MATARLIGLCVAATLLLAAPAPAAQTVGSDLTPDPVDTTCGAPVCTATNTTLPGRPLTALIDGVVVRWRLRIDNSESTSAALQVIRGAGGGSFTGVSTGAFQPIPNGQLRTLVFATRQPIRAGDRIALSLGAGNNNAAVQGPAQAGVTGVRWDPPLANGATSAPDFTFADTGELTFNADVEPDADCDGFGDESQDPSVSGGCLASGADTSSPDTEITKGPKKKVKTRKKKKRVKFEFTSSEQGSTYRCATDGGNEKACTSPYRKKLKRGRHTFSVYAVDAAGNADPTPAERKFKIKRKRKR